MGEEQVSFSLVMGQSYCGSFKDLLGTESTHSAMPRVLTVEGCSLEYITSHILSFSAILESLFQHLLLFSLLTKNSAAVLEDLDMHLKKHICALYVHSTEVTCSYPLQREGEEAFSC